MRIAIGNFRGEIPRVNPRLLPDGFAQRARNARLTSGSLDPYREQKLIHEFPSPVATAYLHLGDWIGFPTDVSIVPGPVAEDRLYYTGDGDPKVRFGSGPATIYSLAVPSPTTAPVLVRNGTFDAGQAETVLYAYTMVTSLDEESAPSPVSAELLWSPGCTVTVSGFSVPPVGRGINRRRIYRSQTSALGVTGLFFVAEVPIATTSYVHDLTTAPIQEILPSSDYDPPPSDMAGLISMPNGMLVAFRGKEILFSEPYVPHAWPEKYRLIVENPIVGLASFGSTLAIMTTGTPYIAQGTAPESMVMERLESGLPCISARGIVDLGYAAAYPSNDGLVLITASSTSVVTRNLFSTEEWKLITPSTIFAANLEGKYVFAHLSGSVVTIGGGSATEDFTGAEVYDAGGAVEDAGRVIFDGGSALTTGDLRALGVIDLSGEQPFYASISGALDETPTGLYYHEQTGQLHVLRDDQVRLFDAEDRPPMNFVWRSKRFIMGNLESFGAIWVECDKDQAVGARLRTRVYADGALVQEVTSFNRPERLPGGFLSNRWEVEVEGTAEVTSIIMAGTIEEMMG